VCVVSVWCVCVCVCVCVVCVVCVCVVCVCRYFTTASREEAFTRD